MHELTTYFNNWNDGHNYTKWWNHNQYLNFYPWFEFDKLSNFINLEKVSGHWYVHFNSLSLSPKDTGSQTKYYSHGYLLYYSGWKKFSPFSLLMLDLSVRVKLTLIWRIFFTILPGCVSQSGVLWWMKTFHWKGFLPFPWFS